MANPKQPISTASYDNWIIWSYAFISVFAVVAIYSFSTPNNADAPEMVAVLQSPQP